MRIFDAVEKVGGIGETTCLAEDIHLNLVDVPAIHISINTGGFNPDYPPVVFTDFLIDLNPACNFQRLTALRAEFRVWWERLILAGRTAIYHAWLPVTPGAGDPDQG